MPRSLARRTLRPRAKGAGSSDNFGDPWIVSALTAPRGRLGLTHHCPRRSGGVRERPSSSAPEPSRRALSPGHRSADRTPVGSGPESRPCRSRSREWLLHLTDHKLFGTSPLPRETKDKLRLAYLDFGQDAIDELADTERTTRHDVKAVEYSPRAAVAPRARPPRRAHALRAHERGRQLDVVCAHREARRERRVAARVPRRHRQAAP